MTIRMTLKTIMMMTNENYDDKNDIEDNYDDDK